MFGEGCCLYRLASDMNCGNRERAVMAGEVNVQFHSLSYHLQSVYSILKFKRTVTSNIKEVPSMPQAKLMFILVKFEHYCQHYFSPMMYANGTRLLGDQDLPVDNLPEMIATPWTMAMCHSLLWFHLFSFGTSAKILRCSHKNEIWSVPETKDNMKRMKEGK